MGHVSPIFIANTMYFNCKEEFTPLISIYLKLNQAVGVILFKLTQVVMLHSTYFFHCQYYDTVPNSSRINSETKALSKPCNNME